MLARVRELPRQLTQARRVAASVKLDDRHRDVDLVLVLGMGGSAIGAELVAGLAGDRLTVPLIVHRDYGLPAWVGPRTLVIAASHSGDTVETLSGAAEARRRGLPLVVASTGGALGRQAESDGHAVPALRGARPATRRHRLRRRPHPRAAGRGRACCRIPTRSGPAVEALESMLERNAPGVETDANPAKQLAWAMFGRIPIVFGAGAMTAVAHRWKTQLNENAKAWAVFEPMPEANHNAIEGTLNPRELSDALYVVELRDRDEPEHIGARYRVVEELLGERATNRSVVWAEGPSALARTLDAVAMGDLVSVYLAILYQTDPTPVTLLAMLKERLARSTD